MSLHNLKWSPPEKKIAPSAYDEALNSTLARILVEFKKRADAVSTPAEMWETKTICISGGKRSTICSIIATSQLLLIFARLIRDGLLDESRLAWLVGRQERNYPLVSLFWN